MSTVTVTPTVEADHHPPRVRLDVTDTGTPAISSVTVVRHNPDGRTVPVRTPDDGPLALSTSGSNRIGVTYDYEMPYGASVSYSTEEDPGTVSASVTVDESRIWLVHLGVPELSVPITLRAGSFAEEEWGVTQSALWPMGRRTPITYSDGQRKAPAGSLTVGTDTLDEMWRLRSLLDDASVLLLNVPPSFALGVDTCYVSIGAARNRRISDIGDSPERAIDLPYQVVDRPAGGTQAERTWADVMAAHATWADVMAEYDTWLDVLYGS